MSEQALDRFFRPHDVPLEYWFWKFRAGDLAFLVDFITRRARGESEVRVSLWVRGQGRVVHRTGSWSTDGGRLLIDGQCLAPDGSTGVADDIGWDLHWIPGPHIASTRPAFMGPMHPFDMEHVLLPDARFTGFVTVAGDRFDVDGVPGLLMTYWGRRLPHKWAWISATEFRDDPGRRVEALIGRTGLWGSTTPQLTAGYVWTTRSDGGSQATLMPLNGIVRARQSANEIELTSMRLDGRRHKITCRADASAFNDLGEGIRQTLLADLVIDGHEAVPGTTGLEFRG